MVASSLCQSVVAGVKTGTVADSLSVGVVEAGILFAEAVVAEMKVWGREGLQKGFQSVGLLRRDSGKLAVVMDQTAGQSLFVEVEYHLQID